MDNMDKKKAWYRQPWIMSLGAVLLFAIISIAYFTPAAFEGRVLFQADGAAASGTGRDVVRYEEETGHRSLWTGSLFGGMPMYQISPSYPSTKGVKLTQQVYRLEAPLDLMPGDSYLIFMMLIGFYIFMRSWKVRPLPAIGGAILWTFSSYFLILIQAGHLWKLLALAYIPPTIAGLVWAFHRRKYLLGFVVTGIFSALQIYSNHIQMSYYFAFLMFAMIIAWGVEAARHKDRKHFSKALAVVILGGIVGIAINSTNLYHTYKYSKETMRGGSELTVLNKANESTSSTGLDKEYITQWSYGIDEMLTFLIPDAKGGASGQIGLSEPHIRKAGNQQSQYFVAQQNRYWGDQPFTAGPVYVGAFVLLLAIFGMLVAKGPMKWAFIGTLILTVMLSWGHNFMWLTSFFIDHFPLYDKFRTPSSILVVAEMIIPIFAIWGLILILKDPKIIVRKKTQTILALALTLGVALLIWIIPTAGGSLLSKMEQNAFGEYITQAPELGIYISALESVRASIIKADALRSILIILVGSGIITLFYYKRISQKWVVPLVIIVCFVDLWSVDKRYLNDDMYMPAHQVQMRVQQTTPIDKKILEDQSEFRVMNLAVNTFNDATTSYNHRSIGGYHAAKLQRYQDLIEGYLSQHDLNVLRALNTKYYIVPDSINGMGLIEDDEIYGNAWFASSIKNVKNSDEEFLALKDTPLDEVAIMAPPFSQEINGEIHKDSLSSVTLTSYAPDRITYRSSNSNDGLIVFSEIYYPDGWHVTINGEPAKLLRANYVLRALEVPAGENEIEMWFDPDSIHTTEAIAFTANIILLLSAISLIVFFVYKRKKKA